jgi:hypothetical protein
VFGNQILRIDARVGLDPVWFDNRRKNMKTAEQYPSTVVRIVKIIMCGLVAIMVLPSVFFFGSFLLYALFRQAMHP